jgi:hypothetical protein
VNTAGPDTAEEATGPDAPIGPKKKNTLGVREIALPILCVLSVLVLPMWDSNIEYRAGLRGYSLGLNLHDLFVHAMAAGAFLLITISIILLAIRFFRQTALKPRWLLWTIFIALCTAIAALPCMCELPNQGRPNDYPGFFEAGDMRHLYGFRERMKSRLDLARVREWTESGEYEAADYADEDSIPGWLFEQFAPPDQSHVNTVYNYDKTIWIEVTYNSNHYGGFGMLIDIDEGWRQRDSESLAEKIRSKCDMDFQSVMPIGNGIYAANSG